MKRFQLSLWVCLVAVSYTHLVRKLESKKKELTTKINFKIRDKKGGVSK